MKNLDKGFRILFCKSENVLTEIIEDMKRILVTCILTLVLLHCYCTAPVFAAEATLTWDPPRTNADGTPLTDLAGFKVYYGTSSRNYTSSLDVGNVTTRTVTNLADGPTYYFAVTAYDAMRNESSLSNEVIKATAAGAQQYTLAVVKAGSGTGTVTGTGINCGTDCSELFTGGTAVTLSARALANSSFGGWSGGLCTGTGACVVTVNGGTTVTATFLNAPPATTPPPATIATLVTDYYRDILGRAPDAGGLNSWSTEIRRIISLGVDPSEGYITLAKVFFNSREYVLRNRSASNFVRDLYGTFLNRVPARSELNDWTNLLRQGLSRNMVVSQFAFSEEFRLYMEGVFGPDTSRPENALLNDLYRGILGRLPDSAGLVDWRNRLRSAQCTGPQRVMDVSGQMALAFIRSAEYSLRNRVNREFVEDLYDAILRRGASPSEIGYWANYLDSRQYSRDQLLQRFVASAEFRTRVDEVVSAGCLR